MLTWLWNLFFGCSHKWEILETTKIEQQLRQRITNIAVGEPGIVGTQFILRCSKCGKLRSEKHMID